MIELFDKESNKFLGEISDEEMKFLADKLEEETEGDEDYYFDVDVLEYLKEGGLSPRLEQVLIEALGTQPGIEIIFKKK